MARRRTRTLEDLDREALTGRRVVARMDYNVPLNPDQSVSDPTRVDATLPTLEFLRGAGARTILVSHLGRPDGSPDPSASLAPVARLLSERLGGEVPLIAGEPGSRELEAELEGMADGGFVLLENIRFLPGETRNDPELGKVLGELGEVFVGDAFGAAHRAHASNVGAARAIQERGGPAVAGFLMARELRFLRDALAEPKRPFLAILGGAKISGKIDLIDALLPRVDRLLIGGAMANTFFRALGLNTGDSLVEEERVEMASELLERAGDRILLPVDCVVAPEIDASSETRTTGRDEVGNGDRIGDIGPGTVEIFSREIGSAGTCVWNGPMGVFELETFAAGTLGIAHALARASLNGTLTVLGGGDSVAAAEAAGVAEHLDHVSTGGGASLELLAGRTLPGVEVLDLVEEEEES